MTAFFLAGEEDDALEVDLFAAWGRSTVIDGPLFLAKVGYEETCSLSFSFLADSEAGMLPAINSFLPLNPPEEDFLVFS